MSNNHEPLISVIIAVYNPGKYLRACLDSIVNQTYKNLEIILIDDGSTDDSLAVCKEYAEKDNRIIVHHKENSGVSATRNQGIRLAHGDYFSFIDSDDFLELDTYEYLMNLMREIKVDIITYEHFVTKKSNEITHKANKNIYGIYKKKDAMNILLHHFPFAWNKLFSKKSIDGVWFNETICRGEDGLFSKQAIDNSETVYFDNRALYHYVQSEESAVRGKFRESQLTAINLIPIYDSLFSEKYPELYDYQMGSLMNLMINLYYDTKHEKRKFKEEQKTLVSKFKEMYHKINLSKLPKKRKLTLILFRFSPKLAYAIRRINLTVRRINNGK